MRICLVDTETTGLQPDYHEVIEVAAIMCSDRLKEIDRIEFRIAPKYIGRAAAKALEINGYDRKTWNPDYFSHKAALKELSAFIKRNSGGEDVVIAGQNVKFDSDFLEAAYKRCGMSSPFDGGYLDLRNIARRWADSRGFSLSSEKLSYFSQITGIVNENPHSAISDVETTLKIMRWFVMGIKE